MAKVLIEAGADINVKDRFGSTLLYKACWNDYSVEAATVLIEAGADVNENVNGKTLLDVAKSEEIKELLLQYGVKHGKGGI